MPLLKSHYDVVIVGAGPVGTTVANLLGKYKVSTLLIDREPDIMQIPRAIGLCEEGSRVLDACGILAGFDDRLLPISRVRFDKCLGETLFFADVGNKNAYPELSTFYQPDLERSLRANLKTHSSVEVATSTRCLQVLDLDDGVEIRIAQGDDRVTLSSSYVLACDGSGSEIRKSLDIGFVGQTYAQEWLIFDATVDPTPGTTVVPICNPDRPGITLPAPNGRRRWEFVVKKGDRREQLFSEEFIQHLLAPWGDVNTMKIERKTIYTFHARLARRFSRGRVFLLGDAAHITPPFAGQGLMAGLRDAYNLCWKIKGVLAGQLSESILETYNRERRPQAKQIIFFAKFLGSILLPQQRWSVALRDMLISFTRALGLHSATKSANLRKKSNHINGSSLRNLLVSRFYRRGFEFPQHQLKNEKGKVAGIDAFLVDSFALIALDRCPSNELSAQEASRWRSLGGKFLTIFAEAGEESDVRGGAEASTLRLEDIHGNYRATFPRGDEVFLVRPDKIIALCSSRRKLDSQVAHYLDKIVAAYPDQQAARTLGVN